MAPMLLLILLLLLPSLSEAAYTIYLRNGSVLSGVSSYEKTDGEVMIYFGGGSVGIAEKDILKIEEREAPERNFRIEEVPGKPEEAPPPAAPPSETIDKSSRVDALKTELESINSEIKAVEEEETKARQAIGEKTKKKSYNYFQLKKLQEEVEPLQQDLFTIQQRKSDLIQRKSALEGELRGLE